MSASQKITHRVMADDLGPEATTDQRESYSQLLADAIREEYPNADVDTSLASESGCAPFGYRLACGFDDDEAVVEHVEMIADSVFQGGEWAGAGQDRGTTMNHTNLSGYVILDRDDVSWGSGATADDAWAEARRDFGDDESVGFDEMVSIRATAAAVAADGQHVRSAALLANGEIVSGSGMFSLSASGEYLNRTGSEYGSSVERVAVSAEEDEQLR